MGRVALFCLIEVTIRQDVRVEWKLRSSVTFLLTRPRHASRNVGLVPVSYPQLTSSTRRSGSILQPNVSIPNSTRPEEGAQRLWLLILNWGNDSWLFRPFRWSKIGNEARNAFVPFGSGTFVCPAKQNFGPRMFGVIVAALAAHITAHGWKLKLCVGGPNGGEELEHEEPLVSDRNNYEWIEISRRLSWSFHSLCDAEQDREGHPGLWIIGAKTHSGSDLLAIWLLHGVLCCLDRSMLQPDTTEFLEEQVVETEEPSTWLTSMLS